MRGRAAPPHPGKTAVEYPPGKRPSWGQKKVATVERLKMSAVGERGCHCGEEAVSGGSTVITVFN